MFSETTERAVLGELEQDQMAAIKRDNEEAVDEQGRLTSRVRLQTFFLHQLIRKKIMIRPRKRNCLFTVTF